MCDDELITCLHAGLSGVFSQPQALDMLATIAQLPRAALACAWRPHTAHPSTTAALALSLVIAAHRKAVNPAMPSAGAGPRTSTAAAAQTAAAAAAVAGASGQRTVAWSAAATPPSNAGSSVQEADPDAQLMQRLVPVISGVLAPLANALTSVAQAAQLTHVAAQASQSNELQQGATAGGSSSEGSTSHAPSGQAPAADVLSMQSAAQDRVLRSVVHPADVAAALAAYRLLIAHEARYLKAPDAELLQQATVISEALGNFMGGPPTVERAMWRAALMQYNVSSAVVPTVRALSPITYQHMFQPHMTD